MAERVALLLKSYLGDAVMAEPVTRAARTAPFLGVRIGGAAREVLHHLSFDATLPLTKAHTLGTLMEDVRALRSWNADVALVVDRSFRAALVARLARVPHRIGHKRDGRSFLLTQALPYDEARYEASCYCDLARAAGLPVAEDRPQLIPPSGDENTIPEGAVGFQPGARYDAKRIPFEASRGLIAHLERQGRPIVLFGGPEERELCERLATSSCTLLAGSCSIGGTIAALSRLAQNQGVGFVSADTGLAHLAFGVGTPSLVVFGPTPATKWTHGPPQSVLQAPDGRIEMLTAEALVSAFESSRSSSPSSL